MTKSEPGWELYRSFLAVMREGSLSGAARTEMSWARRVRVGEEVRAVGFGTGGSEAGFFQWATEVRGGSAAPSSAGCRRPVRRAAPGA